MINRLGVQPAVHFRARRSHKLRIFGAAPSHDVQPRAKRLCLLHDAQLLTGHAVAGGADDPSAG
jgi:hypothetical protein